MGKSWRLKGAVVVILCVVSLWLPSTGRCTAKSNGETQSPRSLTRANGFTERTVKLSRLQQSARRGSDKPVAVRRTGDGFLKTIIAPRSSHYQVATARSRRAEDVADAFLGEWQDLFVRQNAAVALKRTKVVPHQSHTTARYKQTFADLDVFCAEMTVDVDENGGVVGVIADLVPDLLMEGASESDFVPTIDEMTARQRGEQWLTGRYPGRPIGSSSARLVIYAPSVFGWQERPHVAWVMDLDCGDESLIVERVLIDARSGQVVLNYPLVVGSTTEIWDSQNTRETDLPPAIRISEPSNPSDPAYLFDGHLAYEYIQDSRDFFAAIGPDDHVGSITAYVRYSPQCEAAGPCPWSGAMAGSKGGTSVLYFGEGTVTDDTVGHEFTHRVVAAVAGLAYRNESGAIDEAFADMFGQWIDQSNGTRRDLNNTPNDPSDDFITDEETEEWDDYGLFEDDASTHSEGPWRSLSDPPAHGCPDTYRGEFWHHLLPYGATADEGNDWGGVHINAGIIEKMAYLLDGNGQRTHNGITVTGMGYVTGPPKYPRVAKLFYNALGRLTSAADMNDVASALILAVRDYSPDDEEKVRKACEAVGLPFGPDKTYHLHVDCAVSESGCGYSWGQAKKTLEEALAAAASDPNIVSVNVASGTYSGNFVVPDGVGVYGGYVRTVREDGSVHYVPTFDPGVTVLTSPDNFPIIRIGPKPAYNNLCDWLGIATITIQGNGTCDGISISSLDWASEVDLNIANCVITNCSKGVTTWRGASRVDIVGCTVRGCVQAGVDVDCALWLDYCAISGNGNCTDESGGVLARSSVEVTGCTFIDNKGYRGGGLRAIAGMAEIRESSFSGNEATDMGGAVYTDSASLEAIDCSFSLNRALGGGGIYTSAGTVIRCSFDDNTVTGGGGAIRGNVNAYRSIFADNEADYGGAIARSGDVSLVNCTFIDNQSVGPNYGGGALSWYLEPGGFTATNCIFWQNGGAHVPTMIEGAVVLSTCRMDGAGEEPWNNEDIVDGASDSTGTEKLTSSPFGQYGGCHLHAASVDCIDKYTSQAGPDYAKIDIDGDTAPIGRESNPSLWKYDIGADEFRLGGGPYVYVAHPTYTWNDQSDPSIVIVFGGAEWAQDGSPSSEPDVIGLYRKRGSLPRPDWAMTDQLMAQREIRQSDPKVVLDPGSMPTTGHVLFTMYDATNPENRDFKVLYEGYYVAKLFAGDGTAHVKAVSPVFWVNSDDLPPTSIGGVQLTEDPGSGLIIRWTASRTGVPVLPEEDESIVDMQYPVAYQFVADPRFSGSSSGWQGGGEARQYDLTGVMPGSIYAYAVRARYREAPSMQTALSAQVMVLTPPELAFFEATGTAVSVAMVESDENTLSRLKGDPNVMFCFENVTRTTSSGWIDDPNWIETGLTAATTYTYRMKFKYGSQISEYSNDVSAVTLAQGVGDITPPRPNPMQWKVEPHPESNTSIGMTAVTAVDITQPIVYYFECNDPCYSSGWQADPCYVAVGLTQGQLYSFKVKAKDGCNNETAFSSALWACADVDPPGNLTWYQSGLGPWSITLRVWATDMDPNDPNSIEYEIKCLAPEQTNNWMTSLSNDCWGLPGDPGLRRPEWTHYGLQPATQYQYQFRARDRWGNESGWSSINTCTTAALSTNPPSPSPMQWANPYLLYQGSTMLTLQAATATAPAVNGLVEYQFVCTSGSDFVSEWQLSDPICHVRGLSPNTPYSFIVRARASYDRDRVTQDSSAINVTTAAATPGTGVAQIVESGAWFGTINDAIHEAADGQTIKIVPGTYQQTLDLTGRKLTLRGTDPNNWTTVEATVIDSDGVAPVVTVGPHARITLEGLTITGADDPNVYGGGVYVDSWGQVSLIKCIVKDNTASYGGGVYGNARATTCLFENNHADKYGGGAYGQVSLYDCEFSYNSAGISGGAVCGSGVSLVNCILHHNSATGCGGGLDSSSDASVVGCVFYANSSGTNGGGLNHAHGGLTLTNCTILNNTSGATGGGLYSAWCDNPRVTNCIFWGNTATSLPQMGGYKPYLYSSLVAGAYCTDSYVGEQGTGTQLAHFKGGVFLNTNPSFTNEYHLTVSSPCVDVGLHPGELPVTDIDGHRRVMGPAVDIGADEYFVPDLTPPSPNPMTWAVQPTPVDCNTITMTATTATDASAPVVYYFQCTSDANQSSGWQINPVYVNDGLTPGTEYTYQVRARDAAGNLTTWSIQRSATTPPAAPLHAAENLNTGLTYMTIQAAIDASSDGHVIQISQGTHVGAISFNGKDITLRGTDPNSWTVVENTVISGNGAAPVVNFSSGSCGSLEGLTITGANSPTTYGGGVYVDFSAEALISKCLIRDNTASYGGGVYDIGSTTLNRCRVENNHSTYWGGGVYGSQLTAADTVFSSNVAGYAGGGVCSTSVSLTNCRFSGNSASSGGGLDCRDGSTVVGCVFHSNSANNNGGGLSHAYDQLILTNCTVVNNVAGAAGGGLYTTSCSGSEVTNCIFWDNEATTSATDQIGGYRPYLHSSVVQNAYATGSDIRDQSTYTAIAYDHGGFVDDDPNFTDDYHLAQDSPCIDRGRSVMGLPSMDIDGDCRVLHYGIDIGADEAVDSTVSPLSAELDIAMVFTTGGDASWFGQSSVYYYDSDAVQSGAISDSAESWLTATVNTAGTLTFYWKVSSEDGYDWLEFYVDTVRQDHISGTVDWEQKTYNIGSGTHTLKWRYMKDSSVSDGDDCGWLDYVVWTP